MCAQGFFSNPDIVDANHGTFNDVQGNQTIITVINNNHHNNSPLPKKKAQTKGRTKKNTGGGQVKPGKKSFTLSPPLAALLKVEKVTRDEAVEKLLAYAKCNKLIKKGVIHCDASLREIFGVDEIGFTERDKVLRPHRREIID